MFKVSSNWKSLKLVNCTFASSLYEGEGGAGDPPKTFTQDEVNKILSKEKKGFQTQLETLNGNLKLTDEQKKTLEAQIQELQSSTMTEKEKLTLDLENTKKSYDEKLKTVTQDAETWRGRFTSSSINVDLTKASVEHEAINPEQILAILGPRARHVEKLDQTGKGTGEFETKVKVKTKRSDGTFVELDLSPSEAVKSLKETKEYANLYKGTQNSGLGSQSGSGSEAGKIDLKNLTHTQYQKLRKENPAALGLA